MYIIILWKEITNPIDKFQNSILEFHCTLFVPFNHKILIIN